MSGTLPELKFVTIWTRQSPVTVCWVTLMLGYFAAKPSSAALRAVPSAGDDSQAPSVTLPEMVLGSNAAPPVEAPGAVDSPPPPPAPVDAPGPPEPVLPLGPQAATSSAAAKP